MPWMAFAQAFGRQRAAADGAMAPDRLGGIVRATRIKAAILPQIRADAQLVGAQQDQQQCFHRVSCDKPGAANRRLNSTRNAAFSCAETAGPDLSFTGFD